MQGRGFRIKADLIRELPDLCQEFVSPCATTGYTSYPDPPDGAPGYGLLRACLAPCLTTP